MDIFGVTCALGLLIFGAMNTLATKLTFEMKSTDINGTPNQPFTKPWFGVYRMFQGMAIVMVMHFVSEIWNYVKRKRPQEGYLAVDGEGAVRATPGATPLKSYFAVFAPAALDLFGTTCTYVGLFYNSPSIWQMFRGAMVIFATFFSVTVLKRKLNKVRWFGVFIVVVALTIVGIANLTAVQPVGDAVPLHLRLFGMGMILLGMLLQGGQIVVEEFLMKDLNAPPLLVVGMEGVWGCVIMWTLVFPIVSNLPGSDVGGVQENIKNDLVMVENSKPLQQVILVYLFSVFTFNIAGMMVTYQLSAVHRTMLEASRTAVIWVIDLFVFYFYPGSGFGEAWSNPSSSIQLVGFIVLVIGQATYSEIITWGMKTKIEKPAPLSSPFQEPGMLFSPLNRDHEVAAGRQKLLSPTGQLTMGVDWPEDNDAEDLDLKGVH